MALMLSPALSLAVVLILLLLAENDNALVALKVARTTNSRLLASNRSHSSGSSVAGAAKGSSVAGAARAMVACLALATCIPFAALAESNVYDSPTAGATIYKSGKAPLVVGGKKASSDSKAGTRKDGGFLKKMSNCKSDCQTPRAGTARSDCVQDCQDQVCETYEQCTFKIRQSSGNDI
jgi:hypothetical protein